MTKTAFDPASDAAPAWIIVAAMAAGMALAAIVQRHAPVYQHMLDGALVLAGTVHYPPASPMAQYFLQSWTLLHQLGAMAFALGLGYAPANFLFSIIPPALMAGGYVMIVYGFVPRPVFALTSGLACYLVQFPALLFASPDYPLVGIAWDTPSEHSYSWYAVALGVWCFGALAANRAGLAVFSALALVAIHPLLGFYVAALFVAAFAIARWRWNMAIDRRALWAGVAGAALVFISLLGLLATKVPVVEGPGNSAAYIAYMHAWEFHRNVNGPRGRIILPQLALALLLGGFLYWRRGQRRLLDAAVLALLLAVIASSILYCLVHYARSWMPQLVIEASAGRLINVHVYMLKPVFLGLIGALITQVARNAARPLLAGLAALFVVAAAPALAQTARMGTAGSEPAGDLFWAQLRHRHLGAQALVAPELSEAAFRQGHIAPVLFDGLDFVAYQPWLAARVAQLVEEGYGIVFANPPRSLRYRAEIFSDVPRPYWTCLEVGDWARIGRDLQAGFVLVPADWTVHLPVLLSDGRRTLYAIPAAGPATAPAKPCPLAHG